MKINFKSYCKKKKKTVFQSKYLKKVKFDFFFTIAKTTNSRH